MKLRRIQDNLKEALSDAAKKAFGYAPAVVAVEIPPSSDLGDFAFPISFELAKQIKNTTGEKVNPRSIAETLRNSLTKESFIDKVEIAGPGYLNVFLNRGAILNILQSSDSESSAQGATKVMVEHTSVNPNKAAHIGHVRNSVLGDTFARILRANGHSTEVQNYIDNTGVQVADVVIGFMYLEKRDLAGIRTLDSELTGTGLSFDYYCWDLYSKVGQLYQTDEELKSKRNEVLHLIETGGNPTAEIAEFVATRNVECILRTMDRLGIRYDLLPRESEILHLHFWAKAFEMMKERGVIKHETEGKNSGCWVMPFESHKGTDEHDADKILVRSNGTVTYTGKDIAYQLWKIGELGLDFNYRDFTPYPDGQRIWMTAVEASAEDRPSFGNASTVYNVIDTRQSYPQEVVRKGVAVISPARGELASVHLSYEMVALSPAAATELGFEITAEEKQKSFIEMSGRKGLGVKADDLLDRLEAKALEEVKKRQPEAPEDELISIAKKIAVGALRYFLLKFTRNTVVVFDFDEALAFEGETGVYCQYSAVRLNSIFKRLDATSVTEAIRLLDADSSQGSKVLSENAEIWNLLMNAGRMDDALQSAETSAEPAILAKYAFNLSRAFNLFYHNHKILGETDPIKKAVLLLTADVARQSLARALDTLGIPVPEKM